MPPIEEWRAVPGSYRDGYLVSSHGRVRSHTGRILSLVVRNGYSNVWLQYADKQGCNSQRVHRILALAFLPNPDDLPEVNHKNGIRTDNRLENLEWVTASGNQWHASNVLGKRRGASNGNCKLSDQQVAAIRNDERTQRVIAADYGTSQGHVSRIKSKSQRRVSQ